jgi:subtilisin family serine protease
VEEGSTTLGNGSTYEGASINPTDLKLTSLIDAVSAGLPGVDPAKARRCYAASDNGGKPVLDPAKVFGKVVLCDRGTTDRVNKSLAVKQAGGEGMILVNVDEGTLNNDFHYVPSIHLSHVHRDALKAYATVPGAGASIARTPLILDTPAPYTADFSSRGPLIAGGGDVLKPDMIAPGQDILAAVAPPGNGGRSFDLYSGTSMSSPHVAGLAALLKDRFPTWSPMRIKSALMTSAGNVLDGADTDPRVIFSQGAGHVNPNGATDPGLVFDSGYRDWLAFLCGTTSGVPTDTCTTLRSLGFSTDPSDLNQASIAIGDLAGPQTIKRTVTNVGGEEDATYTASVSGLAGIDVNVSPSSFTIAQGRSKTIYLTFTRNTASFNTYSGGQLTLSDGAHTVRSPIVVAPISLAAPATVSGDGSAAVTFGVKFGYNGSFAAAPAGLIAPSLTSDSVADDPTDGSCLPSAPNAKSYPVKIPSGTVFARFALYDADVSPGSDIDLCVYAGDTLVGISASGTSTEEVVLKGPSAGTYTVVVHGWGVAGSSLFALNSWLVGSTGAGNMAVTAPDTASIGGSGQVSLGFSGLASGTRYTGAVTYSGESGMPTTLVKVTTP